MDAEELKDRNVGGFLLPWEVPQQGQPYLSEKRYL